MSYARFEKVGSITPDRLVIEAGIARVITVKSGAGVLPRGTVVGKIESGADARKYLASKKAATDGTDEPDAILADDIDATNADAQGVAYFTGKYNSNALKIDASLTVADVSDAFRTKSLFLDTSLT